MTSSTSINLFRDRVLRHLAQADAAQAGPDGLPVDEDGWVGLTGRFRADPHRTGDALVERTASELDPGDTLLDVGGGAGRLALPLALRCRGVTVVDSSHAMLDALRAGAADAGIDNVTAVFGEWQDASVPSADVVLCSHVVYTEPDVVGFVRKLDAHARKAVFMPTFEHGPQTHLGPIWRAVYGEERVGLPRLAELVAVLTEMGLDPSVEHVRPRMFVRPGTGRDALLFQQSCNQSNGLAAQRSGRHQQCCVRLLFTGSVQYPGSNLVGDDADIGLVTREVDDVVRQFADGPVGRHVPQVTQWKLHLGVHFDGGVVVVRVVEPNAAERGRDGERPNGRVADGGFQRRTAGSPILASPRQTTPAAGATSTGLCLYQQASACYEPPCTGPSPGPRRVRPGHSFSHRPANRPRSVGSTRPCSRLRESGQENWSIEHLGSD